MNPDSEVKIIITYNLTMEFSQICETWKLITEQIPYITKLKFASNLNRTTSKIERWKWKYKIRLHV